MTNDHSIQALVDEVHTEFNFDMSPLLEDHPNIQVTRRNDLWMTENERSYTSRSDELYYFKEVKPGFLQCGFYGHGLNSHNFFFMKSEPSIKTYLRLPYGGVYMDNDQKKLGIINFFREFIPFYQFLKKNSLKALIHFSVELGNIILQNGSDKKCIFKDLYYTETDLNSIKQEISNTQGLPV